VSKARTPDDAGTPAPAPGAAPEEPLFLTLRDVQAAPAPAQTPTAHDDGLVRSDPVAMPAPYLGDPEADRAAQRAARRAEVRRERVRAAPPDAAVGVPSSVPEVLVLAADAAACGELCALLQNFGFGVQVTAIVPELPPPWPFAAVFVAATLRDSDGGDAIDVCNRVRERSRLPGETRPVLMLLALQLSATDRVRAGLAGVQEVLLGAPTRGSVAKALDARGVALPSDARRS
jgi:hypothetical protein